MCAFYVFAQVVYNFSVVDPFSINEIKYFFTQWKYYNPSLCKETHLTIMPLGDSITHGAGIEGSYRIELWSLLKSSFQIDFVGSKSNGPSTIDRDHEGHPGETIEYIQAEIDGWLSTHHPQIVLLMIGTNDMLSSDTYSYATATDRLEELIYQITEHSPNTELLVASIPPLSDPIANARVIYFNSVVPAIVNDYYRKGKRVYYANMHDVLALEDLADGTHPNETGYQKMASVWYKSLTNLMAKRCQVPIELR